MEIIPFDKAPFFKFGDCGIFTTSCLPVVINDIIYLNGESGIYWYDLNSSSDNVAVFRHNIDSAVVRLFSSHGKLCSVELFWDKVFVSVYELSQTGTELILIHVTDISDRVHHLDCIVVPNGCLIGEVGNYLMITLDNLYNSYNATLSTDLETIPPIVTDLFSIDLQYSSTPVKALAFDGQQILTEHDRIFYVSNIDEVRQESDRPHLPSTAISDGEIVAYIYRQLHTLRFSD